MITVQFAVYALINNIKTIKLDTDKKGFLVHFFVQGGDILLIS